MVKVRSDRNPVAPCVMINKFCDVNKGTGYFSQKLNQ